MRLLLVEDDPMIGEAVQDLLRAEHYAVDWARDGDAADTACRTGDHDLPLKGDVILRRLHVSEKEQHQGDAFVEAALQADLEEIDGPLQGEELGWNVLPLALDHIELLDLGDGTEQVDRLVDPASIGGDDLGIGVVCPFSFPFLGHQLTCSVPV